MPRPYPPEFLARAIALVREGRQVKQTALDLGIHEVTLHNWLRQDDIDHGRRPGLSSQESAELRAARGRVRQLEQEIAILRRAATWLDEDAGPLLPADWTAQQVYDHHEVLMLHGQRVCHFRSPACARCVLLDLCPEGPDQCH